jgi:hypothetical protein
MCPLVSDIKVPLEQPQRITVTETIAHSHSSPKNNRKRYYYYYITETKSLDFGVPIYYTLSQIKTTQEIGKQFTLISLAKEYNVNSKPLEGEQLEILNKTFNRLISKSPTRLS